MRAGACVRVLGWEGPRGCQPPARAAAGRRVDPFPRLEYGRDRRVSPGGVLKFK